MHTKGIVNTPPTKLLRNVVAVCADNLINALSAGVLAYSMEGATATMRLRFTKRTESHYLPQLPGRTIPVSLCCVPIPLFISV